MDEWTKLLGDQKPLDCVYLDFQKVFDSVPHLRLMTKLQAYAIKGNLRDGLRLSYKVGNRRVDIDGVPAEWKEVASGVPQGTQGSDLGPILFFIYINDLPNVIHSYVKLLADDARLFRAVQQAEDAMLYRKTFIS